ncbi:MAG: putative membrane protein YfcA [Myxococcota bacterium]
MSTTGVPLIEFSLPNLALLIGSGLLAGFINTIAGGGSLLTVPALALTGLGWDQANASNRVAVLVQSLVAARAFHANDALDVKEGMGMLVPAVLGAILGALLATWVDPSLLEPLILTMLIAVGLLMAFRPKLVIADPMATARTLKDSPAAWPMLFLAGFYGGFLQAGVGYFLLAILGGVLRRDLLRANATKVLLVAGFTVCALTIFIVNDLVDWPSGLILAGASALGSLAAVRFHVKVRQDVIRWVIVGTLVATAVAVVLR